VDLLVWVVKIELYEVICVGNREYKRPMLWMVNVAEGYGKRMCRALLRITWDQSPDFSMLNSIHR
jgi:hypothetical protein